VFDCAASLGREVTVDQQQRATVDGREVEVRRTPFERAAVGDEKAPIAAASLDQNHRHGGGIRTTEQATRRDSG
jgi:hypothetical protein